MSSSSLHRLNEDENPGQSLVSRAEMERWLAYYEPALELAPEASLALFAIRELDPEKPAEKEMRTFVSRNAHEIVDVAANLSREKWDVYSHIHLHALPHGFYRGRGSIETARVAIALFSDIDARGPKRKKKPETLCPTVEDAIQLVERFNQLYSPVSLVIESGHGCYPVVFFREPFLLDAPDDKGLLQSLGRRFHEALHRIALSHGWSGAVDYCDLAKVLRLPGTVNWKDPAKPTAVRVV